jgi:hypothetical protein
MKPVFLNSLDQAVADAPPRPRTIALAGFGVVGQALAARLAGDPRLRIGAILVRDPNRRRATEPPVPLTADRRSFLAARPTSWSR